ncbi:RlpA-like double-psi beta-barrel-protein domain-containing protein-containing protein [Hypoxylon fragiforme]|uniref:RlpA-like double-psi beta-barrel-protein domain-containing protein-containing protein n=1 Tax=Hypoxylon fragiforme TaxID=63214 RepID=UPI0020C66C61|nr:RlpA-like double-psi beta-barrel-protein domain-containing protein-containing protein [Hypoxylon fragiforme]KAI2607226.1 RlpA-like double-psi beta-barrel-protein domain-containing protein-containing protein [Hypoxylon fragiforme]
MLSITKVFVASGILMASAVAFSGDMTYFKTGLGSCGAVSKDTDPVVAMSPNQNGHCGKLIKINYSGKTATATVVDKCPGCSGDSIDVSTAVFTQLAPLSTGRVAVTWDYV